MGKRRASFWHVPPAYEDSACSESQFDIRRPKTFRSVVKLVLRILSVIFYLAFIRFVLLVHNLDVRFEFVLVGRYEVAKGAG